MNVTAVETDCVTAPLKPSDHFPTTSVEKPKSQQQTLDFSDSSLPCIFSNGLLAVSEIITMLQPHGFP